MGERIAIIVAGGSGTRMGAEIPKQFLPLCGKPVLAHTIEKFAGIADRIIVVMPSNASANAPDFDLVSFLPKGVNIEICPGGKTRFESVKNALAMVQSKNELNAGKGDTIRTAKSLVDDQQLSTVNCQLSTIAVHDGVRPLVSRELIEQAFTEAERHGVAIPYIAPVDSFRLDRVPVDRNKLMGIQTPQAFRSDILMGAYDTDDAGFTDDASVVEAAGYELHFIEGERENIKITTLIDLLIAEALCE